MEGLQDDQISSVRSFDIDKLDLSPKEKKIYDFVMKVNGDPHSITDEDVESLRSLGVTDQQIVEAIEVMNFGNSINAFADALGIGPEEFLTYGKDQ